MLSFVSNHNLSVLRTITIAFILHGQPNSSVKHTFQPKADARWQRLGYCIVAIVWG